MQIHIDCVAAFHVKNELPKDVLVGKLYVEEFNDVGELLLSVAKDLEPYVKMADRRYMQAHLMVEELGEMIVAMASGDEVSALDGLCDLLYVTFGTAVTYDWPLEQAFGEVHRSNMTKQISSVQRTSRDKGDWSPPDIAGILGWYRSQDTKGPTSHRVDVLRVGAVAQEQMAILERKDAVIVMGNDTYGVKDGRLVARDIGA
jgi:hypothetical protein